MKVKKCKIPGCTSEGRLWRGWCQNHYKRWLRHGDPLGGRQRYKTPEEAFAARTMPVTETGCLLWEGAVAGPKKYGRIRADGRYQYAHRWAWEQVFGEIPENMLLDHICYIPVCCNVDHMRLATHQENMQNLSGLQSNNTTGFRNITWHKQHKLWCVRVANRHIGYFEILDEAVKVENQKRLELFGEFAGKGV